MLRAALVLLTVLAPAGAIRAEGIKEYQIRRLLMLKTECTVSGLQVEELEGGASRFRAGCENVSHYPDGVEIQCPNTEDDRECRILTARREFPHLRALQR
ncbi:MULTISPECIES: hypothetical protein [Methylobacterium]|jgi:hypothetical protein|uniref:Uncharacterized protein n=1 Tax=Methylobacterium hispanicum TaxID=270350 RepID=A0AAV4ZS83_9HYPH|nr:MULTISPECIES: hypothetical protein [Methylobacterium]GJD91415.1 hypothetical protein BHAOGJBA_4963 [Methylobacterium hispanicum]